MESKMIREEQSSNEAEQSPTRRLQSRAPPSLNLVSSNVDCAIACANRPCLHDLINSNINSAFARENGHGLHAAIPLLTPLAIDPNRPIPLLTPLAIGPKPLPEAAAEREEEMGSMVSHCDGLQHPVMPMAAAAAEPAPMFPFLQPQPQLQCRMAHKDVCTMFYDLL